MNLNSVLAAATLAAGAAAQIPPAIPYSRTMDLLVVDSGVDGVHRLADRNQDGDYNDPGEVTVYYDELLGGIALSNPSCICCAPDGSTYVADSTVDIVLRLRDLNLDGDCNDAGEASLFFDGNDNQSGIVMASAQGITVDLLGRVFVAVANAGSVGTDLILQLEDLDGDGNANGPGEAVNYCTIPGGAGSVGNSIPTKVIVGPDLNLYYAEAGSTGVVTKGVWKLTDVDFDGNCNGPGEVTLFWTPPFVSSPFYWGLAVGRDGAFYVTDHSANERVWRAIDADQSGTIEASEQTLFYQTSGSTWWDVVLRDDGTVLLCEAQAPDRVTALRDLNHDGDALDTGEASQAYDSTIAPVAISPRGAALLRAPRLELSPPIVAQGTPTTVFVTTSKPGELAAAFLSVGTIPPLSLPPFGHLEIDPAVVLGIGFGLADANATFVVPLALPDVPAAVGTWALQAWCGDDFRTFFSNAVLLTVTP
ncbi:MAG: hypothetical protein K8J09_06550 [Planctomycetes bacterium]|nr:hypothetical protein [Planctomycetota bacterium]MCC7399781.1 hypothetical protein [Planctomycetota bacterium]